MATTRPTRKTPTRKASKKAKLKGLMAGLRATRKPKKVSRGRS